MNNLIKYLTNDYINDIINTQMNGIYKFMKYYSVNIHICQINTCNIIANML